jgi:hypothetical protein
MRIQFPTSMLLGLLAAPALALPPTRSTPPPKPTNEMIQAAMDGKSIPGLPTELTPPAAPEDPTAGLPPELIAPFTISSEFFAGLQRHDLESMVSYSRAPFDFDGKMATTPDEVKKGWAKVLSNLGHTPPTLYSLEILPYDEMVKRFGPPPAKLGDMVWKGVLVALANLDGRANLAFLRKDPGGNWRVCGYSD